MIESVQLLKAATYGDTPQEFEGLREVNFVYGSNGTGKTTISRIIADEALFPTCTIRWKGNAKLQTLVYNGDFVAKNFEELKGIFTLGEKGVEVKNQIATAKVEEDRLQSDIENLENLLDGVGGKRAELSELEDRFKEKCWQQKLKHDPTLRQAFEGCRDSKDKFRERMLSELQRNSASLTPLAELETKAQTVFGPTPSEEPSIAPVDWGDLLTLQSHVVLKKRVIGKTDVDIAGMIQRLGNSDWVREGAGYYDVNDGFCPFCQQPTKASLSRSLKEYFDETFETDTKAIKTLETNYSIQAERVESRLDSILASPSTFIDIGLLASERALITSQLAINRQLIVSKKKEPSRSIELNALDELKGKVDRIISSANLQIEAHNRLAANLTTERRRLTSQVWRYLLDVELKSDHAQYSSDKTTLQSAIQGISENIDNKKRLKSEKAATIRALEKQITSSQPTIDAINAILKSFGFVSFSLAPTKDGKSYRIIRMDGADAKGTLSEGEKSFVAFLYFYHLLKGSESEDGVTANRIVVFDDPVSSLDSDILFIVSSLIRDVLKEVREGEGQIKQVFVLTHNVYFHKEVTFVPRKRKRNLAKTGESFWTVRKIGTESLIENHKTNPVKTSYEMLWDEVRNPNRSTLTIQNTLRRIIENYFKILGGIDTDELSNQFEGNEKLICGSLISWMHDGSHNAFEDAAVTVDTSAVEKYLQVFRAIFERTNHKAHYEMMMRTPPSMASTAAALVEAAHA